MIHCKNKCPLGKFDGGCRSCPDRPDCPEACEHDPAQCGDATWDEETALAVFQKSQLATLNAIASLTAHKKAIEEQEKNMKAAKPLICPLVTLGARRPSYPPKSLGPFSGITMMNLKLRFRPPCGLKNINLS